MSAGHRIDYADLVREFDWTRPRHGGVVEYAARILDYEVDFREVNQ